MTITVSAPQLAPELAAMTPAAAEARAYRALLTQAAALQEARDLLAVAERGYDLARDTWGVAIELLEAEEAGR